jgi:hypothetical protein
LATIRAEYRPQGIEIADLANPCPPGFGSILVSYINKLRLENKISAPQPAWGL